MLSEGITAKMGINDETKSTIVHDVDLPVFILCTAAHSAIGCKQLAKHTR